MRTKVIKALALGSSLLALPISASAYELELLRKIDESLLLQNETGEYSFSLKGLLDAEYYYSQRPQPGLLFQNDNWFFNPRLSLFGEVHLTKYVMLFTQFRADRGFDPGVLDRDARFDEYFLRVSPLGDQRLNLQFGKFATVFGSWVNRHDSWHNPFITAPLAYERVVNANDRAVIPGSGAFGTLKNTPDQKRSWSPQIWGPSYASGGSIFGRIEQWEYALEIKNAGLSSRPAVWDARQVDWVNPTFTGRLGYHPNASWSYGVSASDGAFLLPVAEKSPGFPAGKKWGDFHQSTVGVDAAYAHGHWEVFSEAIASRFEIPNASNADMLSWFLETKYKLSPQWFVAARWNQQFFADVPTPTGNQPWDDDAWKIDLAVGWRPDKRIQMKLQYSYVEQSGAFQQGQNLLAAQVTIKF